MDHVGISAPARVDTEVSHDAARVATEWESQLTILLAVIPCSSGVVLEAAVTSPAKQAPAGPTGAHLLVGVPFEAHLA